ncbi:class D beta-lactamase [Maribacter sp.]|nr:class D beta-lactamase [Maribacter sp.]
MQLPKIQYLFLALLFFFSCAEKKRELPASKAKTEHSKRLESHQFQAILDSAKVKGALVIFDAQNGRYHSNDFEWAETQRLPASTFKIPNSIIALETAVVENDSTLFKWNGEKRGLKVWQQDLMLKQAFHFSCVPCYQEIARKIGLKRMNDHLKELGFGAMMVDTTNIDNFWLEGDSKISPLEQIDFLKRLYESNLPISKRTEALMKAIMVIEKNERYTLSGKTGWATANDVDNGWFVGFVVRGSKQYYFATNIEPLPDFDMQQFAKIRKELTFSALRQMGAL